MFETSQLLFFIGAALALLLVPGPAVLYIIARSMHQGRLAGLVSVLGIETAGLVHAAAASLGLSAILMSSALAFDVVKYLGAAYLIYLGIRTLIAHNDKHENEIAKPTTLWRIYSQGVVVNLLNPKTALFFFAFLPQFVDITMGNPALQILSLGILFVGLAICTDAAYAFLASSIAGRLKENANFLKRQRYLSGMVYVGLGVTTALSGSTKK